MHSTVKFLPKSLVEIKVYADQNDWQEAEKLALVEIGQKMEAPGFRPGHAPLSMIKEKVDEREIFWEEVLKQLIELTYQSAVSEYGLKPIEPARVSLPQIKKDFTLQAVATQIASEPIEIVFTVSIWPQIKLDDYKKIVKEAKSGKTIETATTVREAKVKAEKAKRQTAEKIKDSVRKTPQEIKNEQVERVLNALVENISFDLPEVLLQTEVNQRLKNAEEDTKKLGLTLEEYLLARADNLKDFRDRVTLSAEQALRTRLVLEEIAKDLKHPLENEKDLGYIIEHLLKIWV